MRAIGRVAGGRRRIRQRARKRRAVDPAGHGARRLTCAHGPATSRRARAPAPWSRARRGRRTSGRSARRRSTRRGTRRRRRLPPGDDAGDVAAVRALDLERGALREEPRLVGERPQPALHEVRAEVVEQQKPAQQEEGDDQQRRNEADEDVGQDQLAAHAPEQTAFRDDRAAERRSSAAPIGERDAGRGVDDAEQRGTRAAEQRRRVTRTRRARTARPMTIARPGSVRNSACRDAGCRRPWRSGAKRSKVRPWTWTSRY